MYCYEQECKTFAQIIWEECKGWKIEKESNLLFIEVVVGTKSHSHVIYWKTKAITKGRLYDASGPSDILLDMKNIDIDQRELEKLEDIKEDELFMSAPKKLSPHKNYHTFMVVPIEFRELQIKLLTFSFMSWVTAL